MASGRVPKTNITFFIVIEVGGYSLEFLSMSVLQQPFGSIVANEPGYACD